MNNQQIMLYIATWNWIILGMMFLCTASVSILLHNLIGMFGFIFVAVGCFIMSIKRKNEVPLDETD